MKTIYWLSILDFFILKNININKKSMEQKLEATNMINDSSNQYFYRTIQIRTPIISAYERKRAIDTLMMDWRLQVLIIILRICKIMKISDERQR